MNKKALIEKPSPIFIIGSGRSGTTMIGEILTQLGVGKSFEGHVVGILSKKFGNKTLSKENAQKAIKILNSHHAIRVRGATLEISEIHSPFSLRKILETSFTKVAKNSGQNHWIEKTPFYIDDINSVLAIFPDAKFIWCIRDGRDVALSVFKKSWGANNIYVAAKLWAKKNNHLNVSQLIRNENLLRIYYEQFLSAPKKEIIKIVNFVNEGPIANEESIIFDLPILQNNTNKWISALSAHQKLMFETAAFDVLRQHSYTTLNETKPAVNDFIKLGYTLHDKLILCSHLLKVNVIDRIQVSLRIKKPFAERN